MSDSSADEDQQTEKKFLRNVNAGTCRSDLESDSCESFAVNGLHGSRNNYICQYGPGDVELCERSSQFVSVRSDRTDERRPPAGSSDRGSIRSLVEEEHHCDSGVGDLQCLLSTAETAAARPERSEDISKRLDYAVDRSRRNCDASSVQNADVRQWGGSSYSSGRPCENRSDVEIGFHDLTITDDDAAEETGRVVPFLRRDEDNALVDHSLNWDFVFERDDDGDNQLHIAIIVDTRLDDLCLEIINFCPREQLLNIQNDLHQTALHLATLTRRTPIIQALMSRRVELCVCDQNGDTALHLACKMGYTEGVLVLTKGYLNEHNAVSDLQDVIHHKNYEGLTCCHLAALSNVADNLFYLIQDCGADVNIEEGKRGMTVLHVASEMNNVTLVTCLLCLPNIDTCRLTYDGLTAYDFAVGRRLCEMEKLLIQVCQDIH